MTNWEREKEYILLMASRGAVCYKCKVNAYCKKRVRELNIDPAKTNAPCGQMYKEWAELEEE